MIVVVDDLIGNVFSIGTRTLVQIAAPARRVAVDACNIDITSSIRSEVLRPALRIQIRIIVRQRYINSILPCSVFEGLHVATGWDIWSFRVNIAPLFTVLVLNLVNDGITSVGNEVLAGNFGEFREVWFPSSGIPSVVVAKGSICAGRQPKWETTRIGFSIDIWSRTHNDIQADTFRSLQ